MDENDKLSEMIALLKANYNLVLTGSPGTGKTHMAREIATQMGAEIKFVQFHPSYDYTDFVEGLRPIKSVKNQIGFERKDGIFKEFCANAIKNAHVLNNNKLTTKPQVSWDKILKDFASKSIKEGTNYKLVTGSSFTIKDNKRNHLVVNNKNNKRTSKLSLRKNEILTLLTHEVRLDKVRTVNDFFQRKRNSQEDSYIFTIVKTLQKQVKSLTVSANNKENKKPFVLIIDEINRGDASKIFGELFYAIDPGYRKGPECSVETQYQNLVEENDVFAKGFYVPDNVYILATMNDIDRSVECMDFAMRRRFTWREITPSDTEYMLDSLENAEEAKKKMRSLNCKISAIEGLGDAYRVGPAYFLKLNTNGFDFDKLWTMNIEPLLKEYLRGFRNAKELLNDLKEAYKNADENEAEEG